MIEMKDIEKYYKSGSLKSYVLRHVHLDIAEGSLCRSWVPVARASRR
jgi:ABC-type lipoprotein export system ATPase subunit